jgi:hypothetical protein
MPEFTSLRKKFAGLIGGSWDKNVLFPSYSINEAFARL